MRRLIALTAAVALTLPLVLGLGTTPARAEGNTVANVALGLAAFSLFQGLFAPVIVAPAPPVVVPAPVIVRPVPMYPPVYREVPVYHYGHVHAPVYRHGRPNRGHGAHHR